MIFEETYHYQFNPPIPKVHYLFPAYDNSIVMISLRGTGQDQLLHYSKDGDVLYRIYFGELVDTLCQLNEKEVMILRVELDQIWHINLEKQSIVKYHHHFTFNVSCQCFLDYFCESKLLCVREHGDCQLQAINLTYYSTPLEGTLIPSLTQQQNAYYDADQQELKKKNPPNFYLEPYAALQDCNRWDHLHAVRKGNNQSKYIWYQPRHTQQIKIFQAEIKEDDEVRVDLLKISLASLSEPYNNLKMQISIVELWQVRPEEIIMYTCSNKNQKNCKSPGSGVVNNTFIWDLKKNTIRQSRFTFDPKYHDMQIDVIGTSTVSMFRTFYYEPNETLESPAYFIDNNSERIIKQQTWKCSHAQKYLIPDYLKDTISQAIYQNQGVQKISVRTIKKVFPGEMSMFLLLHMGLKADEKGNYEDWDYDLLSDVINAIDEE